MDQLLQGGQVCCCGGLPLSGSSNKSGQILQHDIKNLIVTPTLQPSAWETSFSFVSLLLVLWSLQSGGIRRCCSIGVQWGTPLQSK